MELLEFVKQYKTHPVLFMGTGMSMRYYANSYSWEELLKKIVIDYSDSEEHFYDLKGQCLNNNKCDYPKLGGLIEREFNAVVSGQRLGKFKEINDSFYENMKIGRHLSRFKLYVSTLFSQLTIKNDIQEEISELKKARKNVGSIITTNYDTLIEEIFGFNPLIGNDILLSNPYGSVYKIHGCVKSPGSIIITDDDYSQFDMKYELIRAQLLSIFIHNPIIFLGYSIGDDDIKKLLKTIFTYVEPNTDLAEKIRSQFLLIEYTRGSSNTIVQEHDIDIEGVAGTIRINKLKTDDFKSIYAALACLNLPVSAMDVRKVQSVVKEIYSGGSIKVKITDDIDALNNSDRIIAIGSDRTIKYQYVYYSVKELIKNYFVFIDEYNEAAISVIDNYTISSTSYFPIFGFSSINHNLKKQKEMKSQQRINVQTYLGKNCYVRKNAHTSIDQVISDPLIAETYKCDAIMYAVSKGQIKLDDYEQFLRAYPDKTNSKYRRMLCQYDILRYA